MTRVRGQIRVSGLQSKRKPQILRTVRLDLEDMKEVYAREHLIILVSVARESIEAGGRDEPA